MCQEKKRCRLLAQKSSTTSEGEGPAECLKKMVNQTVQGICLEFEIMCAITRECSKWLEIDHK